MRITHHDLNLCPVAIALIGTGISTFLSQGQCLQQQNG
ncbi:hypothetical protein AM1_3245 [Acaryochloris marina MBIC11017]|uniref:Uncharacterized protein n=1 Tax=Acaryochloris marina (strain MBIC 11017) TaxID=329726 RepID=B0CFT7_ACAM1|nr:hypothetical protein AM1_3245 [Acaryochloris marina MBIC11017]